MSTALIAYVTGHGQTAKIAARIGERLSERGYATRVCDVRELSRGPLDCDLIVLGAPVHAGRHLRRMVRFVRRHRDELERRKAAFFSVSLASLLGRSAGANLAGLVRATGWQPAEVATFEGALPFTRYGIFRGLMRRIWRPYLPGADLRRDLEFTDWRQVDAFAGRLPGPRRAGPPITDEERVGTAS